MHRRRPRATYLRSRRAGDDGSPSRGARCRHDLRGSSRLPRLTRWAGARFSGQAWLTAARTRGALAPAARIVVQLDVLVWRALRTAARREHRDLLVVGSGRHAADGHVGLGETAAELTDHLECPLAIAPRGLRHRENPRLERVGAGFEDGPEALAALELAAAITLMAGANLPFTPPSTIALQSACRTSRSCRLERQSSRTRPGRCGLGLTLPPG